MKIEPHKIYHIYNKGNNRTPIYFNRENYLFFLRKMRKHILPEAHFISYCLMPNHFHWLVFIKGTRQTAPSGQTGEGQHPMTQKIATLLSSYTQAINNQENREGSLFRQKTKAVEIKNLYDALRCFHYIHQNPLKAGLVSKLEEWEFSSFRDFMGLRNGTLCHITLATKLLDLPDVRERFYKKSYNSIDPSAIKKFYK
jgi:REP element-mobilizing transposase RayT